MAVSVDLEKSLDKAFEDKSLKDILDASPAALAGLTDKHAEILAESFHVKSIRELGTNKFFRLAAALVALENAG